MTGLLAYDHVQLAIPPGGEDRMRAFFVDLIGSFPFSIPVILSDCGMDSTSSYCNLSRSNRILRMLRMFKLAKLTRMLKLTAYLEYFEVIAKFNPGLFPYIHDACTHIHTDRQVQSGPISVVYADCHSTVGLPRNGLPVVYGASIERYSRRV